MRRLMVALFISIGMLPAVPSPTSPTSLIFAAVFLIFSAYILVHRGFRLRFDKTTLAIALFLVVLAPINVFVGLSNGRDDHDPIRGIIPFFFFVTYIVFNQLPEEMKRRLPSFLLLSVAVWIISIVSFNFEATIDVLRGNVARLTYSVTGMLIPFGLVGVILLLYAKEMKPALRWGGLLICLILIVASGYRSQLALALAMIAFHYRNLLSARSAFAASALVLVAIAYLNFNPAYLDMMIQRFQQSSGDDVRSAEIEYALGIFSQYPVFGGGAGYPVPVSITRPPNIQELFTTDYVPYIHNFSAYLLMGFGITGFAVIYFIFGGAILRNMRLIWSRGRPEMEAAFLLLLALVAYFHVSASFRQIQMWIVISTVLVILNSRGSARRA